MAYTQFDRVPNHYAGAVIQRVKDYRLTEGKRSLAPTRLQIGQLEILIPRHFGFCFGVERAIHMAFAALDRARGKRLFLVSEIIHNPLVNRDLQQRGIRFLYDALGQQQAEPAQLGPTDVVLIPAFGTTLQVEESLRRSGIDPDAPEFREHYDTTCPFVSKVWDRGEQLGREGYTIVIHGKSRHEETQATQSHTQRHAPTVVVRDAAEAARLAGYIAGDLSLEEFRSEFAGKWSEGFAPERDLLRLAVVNQTTMLAEETQEVASVLREAMRRRFGDADLDHHFADTNDTLCYATNWNQGATRALLEARPDLAVIVGGYNSSNTSHLVEICSQSMPAYLIGSSAEIVSRERIWHFDIHARKRVQAEGWLPEQLPLRVAVTSGASCPDVLMNQVVERIATLCGYGPAQIEEGLGKLGLVEAQVT
jgi:4-hydroxy-3-methylbut-2-enyl diphosphate reductase